jgi:hypothetical protein
VAADSGASFEEVDLVSAEWFDYDEKEGREVSITEVEYKVVRE